MTQNLLTYLLNWIEYIYTHSLIIVTNNELLLVSTFHILDIFNPAEKVIVKDFLKHLKEGKIPLIILVPNTNTLNVFTSDFNELKTLILKNAKPLM